MDWMILPLRRYAEFGGRSRRKEYWLFTLGIVIVTAILFGFGGIMGAFADPSSGAGGAGMLMVFGIFAILYLAILIPSLAVQVRRFHDQNLSGWFVLLNFIPYLGALVVFVFMLLPGTRGPNRFGPDPVSGEGMPSRY